MQKTATLWILVILATIIVIQFYEQSRQTVITDFTYPRFVEALKEKKIKDVVFSKETQEISGEIKPEFEKEFNGKKFRLVGNTDEEGFKLVMSNGLIPSYDKSQANSLVYTLFSNYLPILLIFLLFLWLMKQIQIGGGKAMRTF